jgi:uncharacterized protein (DUF2141 family)
MKRLLKKFFGIPQNFGMSSNGRTRGSGPRYPGSNPGVPANFCEIKVDPEAPLPA